MLGNSGLYNLKGRCTLEQFLNKFQNNPAKKIYYIEEQRGVHKFGIEGSAKVITLSNDQYIALGSPRVDQSISLLKIRELLERDKTSEDLSTKIG